MKILNYLIISLLCAHPISLAAEESPLIGYFRVSATRDTSLDTDIDTCKEFRENNIQSLNIEVSIEPYDGDIALFSSTPSTPGIRGLGRVTSFNNRVETEYVAFTSTFFPEKVSGGIIFTAHSSSISEFEVLFELTKEIEDTTCRLRLKGIANKNPQ